MSNTRDQKAKKANSFKTLLKPFVLISFKESYFFVRNLYGLVFHPFKTIAGVLQKPDWSQTFLIFGLPFYLWLAFLFFFVPVFFLFHDYYRLHLLLKGVFFLFSFFVFILGAYLFYWATQYLLRCKLRPKQFQ
ncbi:MAG: hypothetical protein Q7S03_02030 [bacterium]|nr:hypothetical protein [bacterium]